MYEYMSWNFTWEQIQDYTFDSTRQVRKKPYAGHQSEKMILKSEYRLNAMAIF